jgi:glutathione S-transferase
MTPILHHYPTSPYGELVRTAFGLKGLAWQSVIVPVILPKPGQTELTGGYARTPVLQLGADIYCDTAAILPALDALQPSPSLYPEPLGAMHRMLAAWAGGPQFLAHVGAALGGLPAGALPQGFIEDRRARFGLDMTQLAKATPHLAGQAAVAAAWLDAVLADGRAFLGGDAPGHGDLGFFCNLWFVANTPGAGEAAARLLRPQVAAWFARMQAIGHGARSEIDAAAAIAIARDAVPAAVTGSIEAPFVAGQAVLVRTEGANDPPVAGRLARYDETGITVLRDSKAAGKVAVHFPRLAQMLLPG